MDILIMIVCAVISIGFLVFIHEGGHYLAARAFGVRVTEFMLGLPGPSIGFTKGETRYGVTAVPLGGYAKVCGMEAGEMSPHLQQVLAALYRRGTAERHGRHAESRAAPREADARPRQAQHELRHPHAERARRQIVPALVDEHEEPEQDRGVYYHQNYIHELESFRARGWENQRGFPRLRPL